MSSSRVEAMEMDTTGMETEIESETGPVDSPPHSEPH